MKTNIFTEYLTPFRDLTPVEQYADRSCQLERSLHDAANRLRYEHILNVLAAHLHYLDANLALKEEILLKTKSLNGGKPGRYKPDDELLAFLKGL